MDRTRDQQPKSFEEKYWDTRATDHLQLYQYFCIALCCCTAALHSYDIAFAAERNVTTACVVKLYTSDHGMLSSELIYLLISIFFFWFNSVIETHNSSNKKRQGVYHNNLPPKVKLLTTYRRSRVLGGCGGRWAFFASSEHPSTFNRRYNMFYIIDLCARMYVAVSWLFAGDRWWWWNERERRLQPRRAGTDR